AAITAAAELSATALRPAMAKCSAAPIAPPRQAWRECTTGREKLPRVGLEPTANLQISAANQAVSPHLESGARSALPNFDADLQAVIDANVAIARTYRIFEDSEVRFLQ